MARPVAPPAADMMPLQRKPWQLLQEVQQGLPCTATCRQYANAQNSIKQ